MSSRAYTRRNAVLISNSYEQLKKADLETALDEYMRANKDTLSKNSTLAPFYKRVDGPVRKESSGSPNIPDVKTPAIKKRVSKAKDEIAG